MGFKTRWPPRQQTREEGTLLHDDAGGIRVGGHEFLDGGGVILHYIVAGSHEGGSSCFVELGGNQNFHIVRKKGLAFDFVGEEAAAQFRFEPGGFGRHDFSAVGHVE